MDTGKSLYMADFIKIRENLGTVELYASKDPLYMNLYDILLPKKHVEELEDIIEEIQEKTINLTKGGQHSISPDLHELIDEGNKVRGEVKRINVSPLPNIHGGSSMKIISINPNYVVSD